MQDQSQKITEAIRVSRMYYYQDMTTDAIAQELNVSRSTISRLLTFAKEQGFIEVRVRSPQEHPQVLEKAIMTRFGVPQVQVVAVPEVDGEKAWLAQVAQFTAHYLNELLESDMVIGLAWGTTLDAISHRLIPKPTVNLDIVQLNGAGNTRSMGIAYAGEIISRFAENYSARTHFFPVPTFFDYADTKQALWRERSIRRILDLQQRADLLIYSVGSVEAGIPSHVYQGGYLEESDYEEMVQEQVVGDVATVMFRADGSYQDIPLNSRASGPDLALFKRVRHAVCVVSGRGKVRGLHGVLRGGFLNHLIVDEPTAQTLLSFDTRQMEQG